MKKTKFELRFANPRAQYLSMKDEIDLAISKVLDSESYILGHEVAAFEQEFSRYIGTSFAIGVNSGTDALILSLRALNIGIGDEVIVPSFTAVATVAAVTAVGATPILIDIDPLTYSMDVSRLDSSRTERTKAVIAVHLYGHPAEIDTIAKWCESNSIVLIEDCAQAHGAMWNSRKVGTFGKIACFSFYPTKNLGGIGDGGGIVTNDPLLNERLIELRQYGWDRSRDARIASSISRLDEMQAAILRVKLRHLDQTNASREGIANFYLENLDPVKFGLPFVAAGAKHVFHLFVVRVANRSNLIRQLNEFNIHPGVHYPLPVHLNFAYKGLGENLTAPLTNTELAAQSVLSIPMYPELTEKEISYVAEVLNRV